jgi:Flp pilus assembly pilin Flp
MCLPDWTMRCLRHLIRDEREVTAIECGLIAALISVAAVTVMRHVCGNIANLFDEIGDTL